MTQVEIYRTKPREKETILHKDPAKCYAIDSEVCIGVTYVAQDGEVVIYIPGINRPGVAVRLSAAVWQELYGVLDDYNWRLSRLRTKP